MSFSPTASMAERRSNSSAKLRSMEVGLDEIDYEPRMRTSLLVRSPPPKTTIAAVIFLVGGITFLSLGLSILFSSLISHGKDRGIALIVLGGLSKYSSFFPFSVSSPLSVAVEKVVTVQDTTLCSGDCSRYH